MALQPVGGGIPWPSHPSNLVNAASLVNITLDAAGEKYAYIFTAPKSGNIETIGIRFGTVSTAQDMLVSLQDVNLATGFPDEVVDEFRVIPLASVSSTSFVETGIVTDDGTDGGVKRAVTAGEYLAVVIEFNATIGNLGIASWNDQVDYLPYCTHKVGGSWTNGTNSPILSIKYDDGEYAYIPGVFVLGSTVGAITGIGNGSTPDEIGNIIEVPFSCTVNGAWVWGDFDGDVSIILYDTDGTTPLASVALDATVRQAGADEMLSVSFDPVTLTPGGTYRLVVRPDTATTVTVQRFTVPSAGLLDAYVGGTAIHRTARTDAGAWTDTTTERVWIGVYINELDDGTGGGGGGETFTGTQLNRGFN